MKLAVPLACILLIGTGILAQTRVAPRISAVFPPPEDIRKPDLTIAVGSTPVSMVSYDANGRLLATAGANGAIKMWEARTGEQGTGELVRELAGSAGSILALAPGTTPNLIVAITSDHLLKSWDETTGALVGSAPLKISLEPGHVIFLSGKEPLVATWKNAAISVWNYETGALVRTIELRDEKIASLAFSAD